MMQHTGIHVDIPMKFVRSESGHSVYRTEAGEEVCLEHGTGRVLLDSDNLDLPVLWEEFKASRSWALARVMYGWFIDDLQERVTDPDVVDEIGPCGDCWAPVHDDDRIEVGAYDHMVCESCRDEHYSECDDCEGIFTSDTLHDVNNSPEEFTWVCEACRNENWSWCEDCDEWYADDEGHSCEDCCESPQVAFTVPFEEEVLANDTAARIVLPATLSDVGAFQIATLLRDYANSCGKEINDASTPAYAAWVLCHSLGELVEPVWQTPRGNYTKRMGKWAYDTYRVKFPADLLAKIGTTFREHSVPLEVDIEVTRMLNMSPDEFSNEGSCWWDDYRKGRCALKTNGGFALRSFGKSAFAGHTYREVTGRAWVMPLRLKNGDLVPTFDAMTPDAYMVFNGYDELSGYTGARVMAQMVGMSYAKVSFSCTYMYINAGGYLVAPQKVLKSHHAVTLRQIDRHSNLHTTEATEAQKELTHA